MTRLVHLVVDEVRAVVENPLRRDFRAVSHKINRDFPKSIIDAVDDHFDLGDTYGAFI